MDAFGRLRTSQPYTMFDYYPSASTGYARMDIDIWKNSTTGSATCSYDSSTNALILQCTDGTSSVTRETKQKMFYQAGKSRLMYFSAVMNNVPYVDGNITSNVGIFSNNNGSISEGTFFQYENGTMNVCWAYEGAIVSKVAQSSWNIDTFDGNGPSGITLTNFEQTLLLVIDQEWLGVGRVRFGFNIGGINYYCHALNFENRQASYTKTPRLPLCYQITSVGINRTYSLSQMCCSCMVEGEFTPVGRKNSISTGTSLTMTTAGVKYILLALRCNPLYSTSSLSVLDIIGTFPNIKAANGIASLELQLHSTNGSVGTTSGTLSFSNFLDSSSQYSVGNGSQTVTQNGYIIQTSNTQDTSSISLKNSIENSLLYRCSCTQYDTLYLVGYSTDNAVTVSASMDFLEIN